MGQSEQARRMHFLFTWYAAASAASALASAAAALAAWRRRAMPGGTSLALLLASVTVWSLASACEYAVVGIPSKVLFSQLEYLGTLSSPLFFLAFALEYNHALRWLTWRYAACVSFVPLATLLLAWTNKWHGLIWTGFAPAPYGHNLIVYAHGPAYWIGVVGYSYLLMLAGTGLLVWAAFRFPALYRRQPVLLLAGLSVPWVGNIAYNLGICPLPGLEPTPLLLTISGLLYGLIIFCYGLLHLVPVAREALIETLPDGVLVLDMHRRLVDINPAARRLLALPAGEVMGQADSAVFAHWPGLADRLHDAADGPMEMSLRDRGKTCLEVRASVLRDRRGRITGRCVVLRDISVRVLAEEALRAANERLHAQLVQIEALQADLRDQAIRDPVTGLFNRRFLDDTLERELARAERDGTPLSVVMLDLDHFKQLNDRHGHKAGDSALAAMGTLLRTQSRLGDFACRYGGEEFVVILPDTPLTTALERAEEWRAALAALHIAYVHETLQITLSCGVAVFPRHGASPDTLLRAADGALYAAKAAGRNRVTSS